MHRIQTRLGSAPELAGELVALPQTPWLDLGNWLLMFAYISGQIALACSL